MLTACPLVRMPTATLGQYTKQTSNKELVTKASHFVYACCVGRLGPRACSYLTARGRLHWAMLRELVKSS